MNSSAPDVVLVPLLVVTVMSTVPALPAGTVAVIQVSLLVTNVALVLANLTAVAPLKLVPVILTVMPPAVLPVLRSMAVTAGAEAVTLVTVNSSAVTTLEVPRRRGHADVVSAGRQVGHDRRDGVVRVETEAGHVDAVDGDGGDAREVAAEDGEGGAAGGGAGAGGQAADRRGRGGAVGELVGARRARCAAGRGHCHMDGARGLGGRIDGDGGIADDGEVADADGAKGHGAGPGKVASGDRDQCAAGGAAAGGGQAGDAGGAGRGIRKLVRRNPTPRRRSRNTP